MYLSICIAAALSQSHTALAQNADTSSTAKSDDGLEELVITGYRKSLQDSTNFKKQALGFQDAIFAEDIGKFPDTNVAESFNRVPGITISRDINGEGFNVSIRGLGTNFTRTLLNNAPIAVASTGTTDSQNTDREVDLNVFPTEFMSQLTVSKTPAPSTIEGGVGGTLNMRQARAFDDPGLHLTYIAQGTKESTTNKMGENGAVIASGTWGDFGALFGISSRKNNVDVKGYETIGLTNPTLSVAQCGTGTCNSYGGNGYTIPATVPAGAGNGLTTGATIDNAFLLANNPSLNTTQIDNALIPRLGRQMNEFGERERKLQRFLLSTSPLTGCTFMWIRCTRVCITMNNVLTWIGLGAMVRQSH